MNPRISFARSGAAFHDGPGPPAGVGPARSAPRGPAGGRTAGRRPAGRRHVSV